MQLSEFTIRILLLFLPGIVATLVIEALTPRRKDHLIFYFILHSFVMAFVVYFSFAGVLKGLHQILPDVGFRSEVWFLRVIADSKQVIDIWEVLEVSGFAVLLGVVFSFMLNRKYFNRLAQAIGVTKKFADLDVWHYIFDSSDNTEWVSVRDLKHDLVYEGWVNAFSDTVRDNELFMRDVRVFQNSTGEELYTVPGLYISRNRDDVTIEFPALSYSTSIERSEKDGNKSEREES